MGHEWRLIDKKCIVLFISFMERCPYKTKNPERSWMKPSGYSWSLLVLEFKDNRKFDGSPIIQSFSTWEWGSPASFASWSSTSTISMLKLPNVFVTSTITSFSLPWIISRLMKPVERNEELNGDMSIVIMVSCLTWMTTKIKWSRHRSFLYGCDRSPGVHVLKLEIEIPNLKQHNWSTKLVWEF